MKEFVHEVLNLASARILEYYGKTTVLYTKQTLADVVTEADLASNEIIISRIKEHFPDHGILSEEGEGYQVNSDYCWYVDPLDGTRNFSTGTPLFGVNLALSYKGEVICGASTMPITGDTIFAEKGKGAFLNGVHTKCSQITSWENSFGLLPVSATSPQYTSLIDLIYTASKETAWINAIASSAVTGIWVTSGKRDWHVTLNKNSWDLAAMSLMASEAGATVTNFNGEPYHPGDRGLIVANEHLHADLTRFVHECY